MNWLEFTASLVRSLAWPVAVVWLVIVLRNPIKRVLLTLTHLKYKDLELDFGRELQLVKREAKALDIKPQEVKAVSASKLDSLQLLDDAAEIANRSPQSGVVVAWQAVESELMAAVMRLGISPDYPPYTSALKHSELLREQGIIDGAHSTFSTA
jgi:hypothetical protein